MSFDVDDFLALTSCLNSSKTPDDELGGYSLYSYFKQEDRTITEVEIPAEFNGEPEAPARNGCNGAGALDRYNASHF